MNPFTKSEDVGAILSDLIQGIDDAYTALQDGDQGEYLQVKDEAEKEATTKILQLIEEAELRGGLNELDGIFHPNGADANDIIYRMLDLKPQLKGKV